MLVQHRDKIDFLKGVECEFGFHCIAAITIAEFIFPWVSLINPEGERIDKNNCVQAKKVLRFATPESGYKAKYDICRSCDPRFLAEDLSRGGEGRPSTEVKAPKKTLVVITGEAIGSEKAQKVASKFSSLLSFLRCNCHNRPSS